MKHGSLFSGIGGFDLAADLMNWQNIFHCEINEFNNKILKYYWPDADSLTDIKTTNFKNYANKIDILTGGFPCQPFSQAGKRKGTADERHLWPEMLRAIREIQPRYIVGENVRGLINWDAGLVFDQVQIDLEFEGYQVIPFLLPACAVNAPHRRDRIWFIAHNFTNRSGQKYELCPGGNLFEKFNDEKRNVTNTNGNGCKRSNSDNEIDTNKRRFNAFGNIEQTIMHTNRSSKQGKHKPQQGERQFNRSNCNFKINQWQNFPTQPPICSGNDGLSGKLDGITFSKWRSESIKGYGNAIVPQVALQIFKAIQQFDDLNN